MLFEMIDFFMESGVEDLGGVNPSLKAFQRTASVCHMPVQFVDVRRAGFMF